MVSMYASLSRTLPWSMPPHNRQRVERMTSNPENAIIIVALDKEKIVGHIQITNGTSPRFREMGDIFV